MKKLSEIAKLPVMEILNGQVAGTVKDIVMHPDTKGVLMVMDEGVFSDFHILQRQDVQGIGADFIMIKTRQAIKSSRENPELAKTLVEYYLIMGSTVITSDGNIISKIKDFTIDESNWQISEIILENGMTYDKDQILSVSEKYVFVQASNAGEEVPEEVPQEDAEEDYLIGLTLKSGIASEDGQFVLEEGTVLTKEMIEEAKAYGVLANLILDAE